MSSLDPLPRIRGTLLRLGEHPVETAHGPFSAVLFHDLTLQRPMLALLRGPITSSEAVLCRVHSSCVTSELLGACDCDCSEQLDAALDAIDREGRGALFYLMQEGRGAGLAAKASDRMIVQASGHRVSTFEAYEQLGLRRDQRRYDSVAAAIELLGIGAPLRLMTNNLEKSEALEREKVQIAAIEPLERDPSPFNAHYLGSKRASGHVLSEHALGWAEPPGPVERISPERVAGEPGLYLIASYWLPVPLGRRLPSRAGAAAPSWLRAYLYLDLARRAELVALEWPARAADDVREVPLYAFGESLFDRLPLGEPAVRGGWHDALDVFARADAGLAVFAVVAHGGAAARSAPNPAAVAAIARRHVRRPIRVLPSLGGVDVELHAALVACGSALVPQPPR